MNDEEFITRLRQHLDSTSERVDGRPDTADVYRRRQRRTKRRRLAVGAAVASIGVVTALLAWPRPTAKPVVVATRDDSAADRTADAAAEERAEAIRLAGNRPNLLDVYNRTTTDGLEIRSVLLDRAKDPAFASSLPLRCQDTEGINIIGLPPENGVGGSYGNPPRLSPGTVWVSAQTLYPVSSTNLPKLPDGSPDPRIPPDRVPVGAPTVVSDEFQLLGYLVSARGDSSLRSLRVSYGGYTDEAEARNGIAIAGGVRLPDNDPVTMQRIATVTLTFADGTTVDVNTDYAAIVGADGEKRPSASESARAGGRCEPIAPSLPPPGRAPSDEPAARAAVTAAIETAANGSLPIDERILAFADAERARRIVEELTAAPIAELAGTTATVKGIVFVSPTEAVVNFAVDIPPGANGQSLSNYTQNIFGKVVLSDGSWLMTSETACGVLNTVTPKACEGVQTLRYPPEAYVDPSETE